VMGQLNTCAKSVKIREHPHQQRARARITAALAPKQDSKTQAERCAPSRTFMSSRVGLWTVQARADFAALLWPAIDQCPVDPRCTHSACKLRAMASTVSVAKLRKIADRLSNTLGVEDDEGVLSDQFLEVLASAEKKGSTHAVRGDPRFPNVSQVSGYDTKPPGSAPAHCLAAEPRPDGLNPARGTFVPPTRHRRRNRVAPPRLQHFMPDSHRSRASCLAVSPLLVSWLHLQRPREAPHPPLVATRCLLISR
jgi:hypothetical protein